MAENWSPKPLMVNVPPASLLAAIDSLREANELIWSWDFHTSDGCYSINLIREHHIEQAERMHDIGLGAGEGRSFWFARRDRCWVLIDHGRWIG